MEIRQNFKENGRNTITDWSSPMVTDPQILLMFEVRKYGQRIYKTWYNLTEKLTSIDDKIYVLQNILDFEAKENKEFETLWGNK